MTLIDGDRIITAQLYDDEHEEFTEKKMSIIDYINDYTDEGVTEADVVEQTRWIPVSERLPEEYGRYLVTKATRKTELEKGYRNHARLCVEPYTRNSHWGKSTCGIIAWMPLPEPYKAESEE